MTHKFNLILEKKLKLTNNTEHFRFAIENNEDLAFKAGQFISLHLVSSDGKEHRRNYSIANAPQNNLGANKFLELAMAYLPNGLASTFLDNMQPGEIVTASGPYGQFILKDEVLPQRYILIGTGTGITPYRSMLPSLSELLNNTALRIVILQGVRTRADLLYGEEFAEFARNNPKVIFKACYSRDYPEQVRDYEVRGYVQNHLEELHISPGNDIAYLCGNPLMVDEAFQKLQELGLDRAHIRREKYISSKS